MSNAELSDFLTTRRARMNPQQAGLPTVPGSKRRVPGLRREEVAMLSGISVEYYTKLERGHAHGVSDSVRDALSRALQLDTAEQAHLADLLRDRAALRKIPPARTSVRKTLQQILDSMNGTPAYVRNGRSDVLAANELGRALYWPLYQMDSKIPNMARYIFLDPTSPDFFPDFGKVQNDAVAMLRASAGRDPYDGELTALIGELSTRSQRFAALWAEHDVRLHQSGTKRIHHPVVGELTLSFEAFDLPSDPGQRLNVYTAAPDSAAAQSLAMLATWAATTSEQDLFL